MPVSAENRARYPKDWKRRSRFVRFIRAGNCCEWCGVPNYAVGQWVDGRFRAIKGNRYLDSMGYRVSYRAASNVRDYSNSLYAGNPQGRYIVIVLTVAHVHDMAPEAAGLLNLAALCQRCHNRHDQKHRAANRRAGRSAGQLKLI